MKLITNRIHTGKAKSFDEIIKQYTKKEQVKTASVEDENIKVAEQEEAESSGQLDVEPLHQKGESTEMPKKGPSAKKEGVDGPKSASSGGDPEKEGEDSGQCKAEEPGSKFTNDPKFDPNDIPKSEKGGSADEQVKEAAATCEKCKQACAKCTCEECDCKPYTAAREAAQVKEAQCEPKKDDEEKKETKEARKLPEALEEHKFTKKEDKEAKDEEKEEKKAEAKDEDDKEKKEAKVEDKKEEEKEAKVEDKDKEEKEAKAEDKEKEEKEADAKEEEKEEKKAEEKTEFVKVANLDAKNKAFLTEYWRQLFGEDYVNALVADK